MEELEGMRTKSRASDVKLETVIEKLVDSVAVTKWAGELKIII